MIRYPVAREKAASVLGMFDANEAPVNVIAIAEKLGFKVVPFSFPDTMSAVVRIYEDGEKVIGVNKDQTPTRQRFSIAHELGHYLCGHESYSHDQIVIDPSKKYLDPGFQMEQEADEFAAELLMPSYLLSRDMESEGPLFVERLAKKYDVSEQALWIQILNVQSFASAESF
ncbi:MAG: ImmA/IrrE family metallo-endopeptidase [Candidatus Microsaccharimonas sp.]